MTFTPGQLAARGDLYFQLANLVTAGVPLIDALEMTRRNANRTVRAHLDSIVAKLQGGATFGEALSATGAWLPAFDHAVISASEQTGRLDRTLKMLGNYYKERAVLTRRILSDMAYPFFIIHMAVLIFPTSYLTGIFLANGLEKFVAHKVSILLPVYAFLFALIVALQGNRGTTWRSLVERILNTIPLVGSARKSLALARFAAGLEALLSAGVPIIEAWQTAARASGSNMIDRSVAWAVPRMETGMVPSEAMRQLPVFPELFRNLYTSGEVSGQLDSTLQRLHNHYQEDATMRFQNIGQWAPKVLFLIVAIAIGYQVITFYTNYFGQLNNLI